MRKIGLYFVALLFLMLVLVFAKKGIYSSVLGINVIIVGDSETSLMLLRPKDGVMTWVRLPDNLTVKISNTGALYPLSSLWKYGLTEKNAYRLVSSSLSETVGVPLPRVIKLKGVASPENLLGSLLKLNLQTDFSVRDRLLIRKDLTTSVTSKKIFEIEIPKSALTKNVDPDGQESLEINFILSLWTKNKFVFETLLKEAPNVKIFNLSTVKGAGLQLSRHIEASGLRVVELGSEHKDTVSTKGCSFKSYGDYKYSEYLLSYYIGCKNVSTKSEKGKGEGIVVWIL